MIVTKKVIPRRTVLRGVGTALALPLLDGMVPALTALTKTAAAPTKRLGVVVVPNGISMSYWTPRAEGAGEVLPGIPYGSNYTAGIHELEATPILKPLEPFREQMLVMTGLDSRAAAAWPGEPAMNHSRPAAAFLTGVHAKRTTGSALELGISMDQIAANAVGLGRETLLPSLELSIEGTDTVYGVATCDGGYSCAYLNISWANQTTPMPRETNPRIVFERLFGDVGSTSVGVRLERAQRQRSILDAVMGKVTQLKGGLAPYDRAKLDEYLQAVREIERRIQIAEQQADRELPAVASPSGIPPSYEEHVKMMYDLLVLAYQTDMTRVCTYMVGREESGATYPQLGVADPHHPLSHHQNDPERLKKLAKINTYHTQLFSDFLAKLRSTPDGEGSLLDHVMLIYGSALRDGNQHSYDNLPILVVGGGCGEIQGGRHVICPKNTPLTNLEYTMLLKMGVSVDHFGDSDGEIQELSDLA